jgi:L-lactate dehydrogenase (cytochrome)/(S)-mandelate dehydrogenase
LRSRILTGVTSPDLSTKVGNTRIEIPVALAPTGGAGSSHHTGDAATARAAESMGTRLALSTAGSYTLEDLAQATEQDHWFQLYPLGDRAHVAKLIARAEAAGYTALFVTVDVPVLGNREGERIWSLQMPWTVTPARFMHLLPRWRWIYEALYHKRLAAPHYLDYMAEVTRLNLLKGATDAAKSAAALARQMHAELNWNDLKWMRDLWKGPLYVKGVLDPDDAARCVDEFGAQGVVVSNHGGRQLERCLASIDALPAIVDRIGSRAEVFLDGGVRRGTDVITALCLGARAVFIGRPYLYGLAANGQAGVRSVLEIFRDEIQRDLCLMGCPSVAKLDRSWLIRAEGT